MAEGTDTTPTTEYVDTTYTDTTPDTTKKSTAVYWIIGIIILAAVIALVFYKKKGNPKRNRL